MPSIRRPKRIRLHGSDQREYAVLAKGGEDLRLDQRVQTIFAAMNRVMGADAACASRGLSMRTYMVTPMSASAGLIEWMSGMTTLRSAAHTGIGM